jgi:hypothetical protein
MALYSPKKSIRKSPKLDTAVSMTPRDLKDFCGVPRDLITRCHCHCGIRTLQTIIRFNDTFKSAESYTKIFMLDPAVSLRPRDPIPRCHWHCGIRSHNLTDTAEFDLSKWFSRLQYNTIQFTNCIFSFDFGPLHPRSGFLMRILIQIHKVIESGSNPDPQPRF